jgi:hypothetical protein
MPSDAEQRIETIKLQNKQRAKKYYEAHKEEIAGRRKAKRSEVNRIVQEAKPKPTAAERKHEELKDISLGKILKLIDDSDTLKPDSKRSYKSEAKKLARELDITDFTKAFLNSKHVIEKIENAKKITGKTKGELYSTNTKKQMYQFILKLMDDVLKIKLPEQTKSAYEEKFEVIKVKSTMEADDKKANEEVMDYDHYLDFIEDAYGKVSKEYIIASLYSLSGFRDNLQLELIPKETPESKEDLTRNYLTVNPHDGRTQCMMILNKYKTDKKYHTDVIKLPQSLSNIIKKYINEKDMSYGDYLFGDKKLSGTISKFNREIGLNITINTLRQMRVSKEFDKNEMTAERRVKLAREMKHAPQTTARYKRTISEQQEPAEETKAKRRGRPPKAAVQPQPIPEAKSKRGRPTIT